MTNQRPGWLCSVGREHTAGSSEGRGTLARHPPYPPHPEAQSRSLPGGHGADGAGAGDGPLAQGHLGFRLPGGSRWGSRRSLRRGGPCPQPGHCRTPEEAGGASGTPDGTSSQVIRS